ncbi:MAG TPA: type II toxin-antitoxin system RelE/ParE family toxin [Thermoanaerobaculia bacterium]|nr:type II toxin-antitoxin system RelE/ParE family toxin [Thermoanaerobaculia bacterium]HQR66113.1 type II toxin-antitoxin system RelE/ParE family toxin [Thermoanaerobaculia bacterium]
MIRSFGDAATEQVLYGEETRVARRLPKELWPLIRRKLDALNAAVSLVDLRLPPGNRLEALKGDRKGRYSIRVNERYRITFRFENGHAWEVRCEDYH